jgi:hypothetical protein
MCIITSNYVRISYMGFAGFANCVIVERDRTKDYGKRRYQLEHEKEGAKDKDVQSVFLITALNEVLFPLLHSSTI